MNHHTEGLHHHHVRKRVHQKHEPYPHPDKWKNIIDKLIYPIGILGPIFTIPQLLEIWMSKDATSLSILTWSSWVLIAIFWLIYGLAHSSKPIIISNTAWIAVDLGVILGIILYN